MTRQYVSVDILVICIQIEGNIKEIIIDNVIYISMWILSAIEMYVNELSGETKARMTSGSGACFASFAWLIHIETTSSLELV